VIEVLEFDVPLPIPMVSVSAGAARLVAHCSSSPAGCSSRSWRARSWKRKRRLVHRLAGRVEDGLVGARERAQRTADALKRRPTRSARSASIPRV